ncbi:hypothetical protein L484_018887 [Morus notabilis]|uniref:Uncharacterized protein n=1 Tax=Morus notabilis TaxID=981085 RepID=W9QSL7_9ROSA|nr:hypothetical protein L484_018887 [Morus notabilis]
MSLSEWIVSDDGVQMGLGEGASNGGGGGERLLVMMFQRKRMAVVEKNKKNRYKLSFLQFEK